MNLVAMILAAGRGRRLGRMGERIPKTLVQAGDRPLLASILQRVQRLAPSRIVINTHHLSSVLEGWLRDSEFDRLPIAVSREDYLCDTGGALRHAAHLLETSEAILVHNGDIWTDADLKDLIDHHARTGNDVTIVTRQTGDVRSFLVDDEGLVKGWEDRTTGRHMVIGMHRTRPAGYAGILVASPALLTTLSTLSPVVSLVKGLLAHIEAGARIGTWDGRGANWFDVGTPERLRALRQFLACLRRDRDEYGALRSVS